jgi:acetyl-CoA C-acetyltransferase
VTTDPRNPVLVGAGVAHQRHDDPTLAAEAIDLMTVAAERAAEPAGGPALLGAVDAILVPEGTWSYADPGRLLADRFHAPSAHTLVADVGVLQQTIVTRACELVGTGRADVVLVVGGEAKFRDLRARITGNDAAETAQGRVAPDERLSPASEILPAVEIHHGLAVPAHQYAVMETALRAAEGLSPAEHARRLAALWAAFGDVARANPDAWDRDPLDADALTHPSAANPLLAMPYTKRHCSQWNVDQAAALLICSQEAARRFGRDDSGWVFPVAAVESNAMLPLSRRARLHRSEGLRQCGERLATLTGVAPAAADHLDLYSCFPAAVQIQARELGIDTARPLTVTGGMTFAGGPLNNYGLQALAALASRLRGQAGETALVTSVSGMLTKQGAAWWSSTPPPKGFRHDDVSEEVAAQEHPLDLLDEHTGAATIAGYTVAHAAGEPVQAVVIATTADGRRCVATSSATEVLPSMVADEWVGRTVEVRGNEFHAAL